MQLNATYPPKIYIVSYPHNHEDCRPRWVEKKDRTKKRPSNEEKMTSVQLAGVGVGYKYH